MALAAPAQAARAPWTTAWYRQAMCIHHYETLGSHGPAAWRDKSNASSRGGMQFLYSTWASIIQAHHLHGYPADPASASRWQQLYAAWLRWNDDHGSWHEWTTHTLCHLE